MIKSFSGQVVFYFAILIAISAYVGENWLSQYIGVTEGKIEKEGKMSFSIFIFIYTIHLAYLKVYTKFENTGSNRSGEICDRNFHWRERKMNK